MSNLFYAIVALVLFWIPIELVVKSYYIYRTNLNRYELDKTVDYYMRYSAPAVALLIAALVPEAVIKFFISLGLLFHLYLIYVDRKGALEILKGIFKK